MPTITKQSSKPVKVKPSSNGSAWDLTDAIKMLCYGKSGSGKTTLWASFPSPILALVCSGGNHPGELRSVDTPENRKRIKAPIIKSTDEVRRYLEEAGDYATLVLDHGSGLQDLTLKEILGLDELPAQKSWGMASQQQYGQSSLMCKELFRAMLSLPCNVVIVAQERVFNEESDSDLIAPTVGAALTPSVTGWLNPACDFVVQTYKRPIMETVTSTLQGKKVTTKRRGRGVEYCLRTEPHDIFQTKFRMPKGRTLPECIVNPDYQKILTLIKG